MNFQQLTTKLLAAKGWPFYLVCVIAIMAELLNAVLNIINNLIWWKRIDIDLLIIGSINALAVTLLLAPVIIYLIRHSFNLEEMNRRLQGEIDERTKTEAALRQNEKLLRMITDNSRDIIWMTDMNFRFTYLSPAVEQLLGYTVEEYLKLDYQVIAANSGAEAIEICRSRNSEIDLLILDMIMPGMNGSETFDQLKTIDPRIKVILLSGYSLNEQASGILKKGCHGFIQKPFNVAELSQFIRTALEN